MAKVDALVHAWIERLSSSDAHDTSELEAALVRLGGRAVDRVAWTLRQNETAVPAIALAHVLGRLGAIETIGAFAKSESADERLAAANALSLVPTAQSVTLLVAAMDDASDDVADAAALALTDVLAAKPELVERCEVVRLLRERPRRDLAAGALGRLDTTQAHAALLSMLSSRDEEARSGALSALWSVGRLEDAPAVRDLLRRSTPIALRKKASLVLGRLQDRESVPELMDELDEKDDGLVQDAHWALCAATGQHLAPSRNFWSTWWASNSSAAPDELVGPRDVASNGDATAPTSDRSPRVGEEDDSADRPRPWSTLLVVGAFFGAVAVALFVVARRVVPPSDRITRVARLTKSSQQGRGPIRATSGTTRGAPKKSSDVARTRA